MEEIGFEVKSWLKDRPDSRYAKKSYAKIPNTKPIIMDSPDKKHKQSIHYWWIFILAGIGMLAFSIYIAVNQRVTYDQVSFIFAAMLIIIGLLELAFCILNRTWFSGWGWYLAGAVFDLVVAAIFITNPILAGISLPFFAGFWLLIRSAIMIRRSVFVKKNGHPEWPWLLLWAITGAFFSIINIYNPIFGGERPVVWTTLALFTIGIFYIHFGWLIRNRRGWVERRTVS